MMTTKAKSFHKYQTGNIMKFQRGLRQKKNK